jgi:hypothetical protein
LHSGMLFYASHLFDVMGTCMILWVHVHDCIIYIYLPPSIYLCISDCMEWSYYIARALMFFCFCDDGFWVLGSVCIVCCIPVTQSPSFSNLDSLAQYLKQSISEPGLFLALYSEPWSCRNLVFPSPVPRMWSCWHLVFSSPLPPRQLFRTWFSLARYLAGACFRCYLLLFRHSNSSFGRYVLGGLLFVSGVHKPVTILRMGMNSAHIGSPLKPPINHSKCMPKWGANVNKIRAPPRYT